MLPQNKKIASLILADASGLRKQEQPEVNADMAFDAGADKFFKAIEAKDKKMLIEAFKDLYMLVDAIEDAAEEQMEIE